MFIDRSKLSEADGAKVSAAGPIANLLMAALLLLPFLFGIVPGSPALVETTSLTIAPILAFSAAIQIIAALLNSIPIPPLDGFGIIEPLVPQPLRVAARRFGGIGFIILFLLIFQTGFGQLIFEPVSWIFDFFGIDSRLIREGFTCFSFWSEMESDCDLGRQVNDASA